MAFHSHPNCSLAEWTQPFEMSWATVALLYYIARISEPQLYKDLLIFVTSRSILHHKKDSQEHCSGFSHFHFDQNHGLKGDLMFLPNTSFAIEQWLPNALQALKGSFVDLDENDLFCSVLQRICQTRDKLPGLGLPASQNWSTTSSIPRDFYRLDTLYAPANLFQFNPAPGQSYARDYPPSRPCARKRSRRDDSSMFFDAWKMLRSLE